MNSVTNDLITTMELAALLRVGRTGLWRIRKDPAFPQPIMIGRRLRWRRADIDRWIDGKLGEQSTADATRQCTRARSAAGRVSRRG